MSASRTFERVVGAATRRPLAVVVVVALLAAAGGLLALQLRPSADPDTLVSRGAESFRATAVMMLFEGPSKAAGLPADSGIRRHKRRRAKATA